MSDRDYRVEKLESFDKARWSTLTPDTGVENADKGPYAALD